MHISYYSKLCIALSKNKTRLQTKQSISDLLIFLSYLHVRINFSNQISEVTIFKYIMSYLDFHQLVPTSKMSKNVSYSTHRHIKHEKSGTSIPMKALMLNDALTSRPCRGHQAINLLALSTFTVFESLTDTS